MGLEFFNVSWKKMFLKFAMKNDNLGIYEYFSGAEVARKIFFLLLSKGNFAAPQNCLNRFSTRL